MGDYFFRHPVGDQIKKKNKTMFIFYDGFKFRVTTLYQDISNSARVLGDLGGHMIQFLLSGFWVISWF